MLRRLDGDERRAAGHAGASGRATGRRDGHPIERVADRLVELPDLPGARLVHHDLRVLELLVGAAIGTARDPTPELLRHHAILVPVVEQLRRRLEALVHDCGLAFASKIFAPSSIACRGTGGPSGRWRPGTGACTLPATSLATLPHSSQVALAGHRDAGLLEQGLVDERTRQGQLRHHAGDRARVAGQPHPFEEGTEIRLPIGRVLHVGPQVEHEARQAAEIVTTRASRAPARPQAAPEEFSLIALNGTWSRTTLMSLFSASKRREEVGHDLALVAVRVPGHSQSGLGLRRADPEACRDQGAAQEQSCPLHRFLR